MTVRRFEPDHSGIAATVHAANDATVKPLAGQIADDAQRLAPVLTGALMFSIRVEHTAGASTAQVVAGGGPVDYAAYQEFGTSKMAAQPYLAPAAYRQRSL